jgi:MFS family permease
MINVIILGLVSLFTDISSEMIYPLIPLYLTLQLGASPAILGFVEGVAESIASLVKVFSGLVSDKFRRRKLPTITGYSLSAIGKLFLYLSSNWLHVFFSRSFDRFGKGIRTAPRDALISESIAKEKRGMAFGLHRMMDTLGAAVGVVLAYYFLKNTGDSYRRVFLYALIPAVLGIGLLFLVRERKYIPETRGKPHFNLRDLKSSWQGLDKKLKAFLIISLFFTLGNSSNQFLLLRAKTMGFSITDVLLLYLVYNLVSALTALPAGKISDKIGRKTLIVWGYIFYAVVYLGFAITKNLNFLWGLFALYGIYSGLTEGMEKAFIADNSSSDKRATVLGLYAAIVGMGLFPASLLAGLLWRFFGPGLPFYFGSVMGFLAAVLLFFLI